MQDKVETMVRVALAEALREMATILSGSTPPDRTDWPRLRVADAGEDANGAQGHGHADVYVAGCSALSNLAQRLKIPIFKIGATRQPLLTRQSDLRADRYGSAIKQAGKLVAEPGYDDWEMRRLEPIALPGPRIELVPRALRVDLTMPFGEFEVGLCRALRPYALETWARSDAGRSRLRAIDAEAALASRYTLYGFGDQVRSSPCNELYVIRPRVDMSMICRAVESVLCVGSTAAVGYAHRSDPDVPSSIAR